MDSTSIMDEKGKTKVLGNKVKEQKRKHKEKKETNMPFFFLTNHFQILRNCLIHRNEFTRVTERADVVHEEVTQCSIS